MLGIPQRFRSEHPVALITGTGQPRLGRTMAQALHERGCRIVLHTHHRLEPVEEVAAEWSSHGAQCLAIQADLADEQQVAAMCEKIATDFGSIDVLVHSSAMWRPESLESVTSQDLDENYHVNQRSTFLVAQHVGLQMVKQEQGGSILLMGDWALSRPYIDYSAYFMAKGSVPTLTKVFATELGQRNPAITVNCVMPGPVTLPNELSDAQREQAIRGTLVQREGTPDHVAHLGMSLLENEFVTGVCVPVDGGRSIFAIDDDYKQQSG